MGVEAPPAGLIGRDRELDVLRGRLAEARAGTGRLVLCVGEPGIGKTRLAQEIAGAALAEGVPVAWGRCAETVGAPPYWPWHQVLRSLRLDPDTLLAGDVASPDDRFRVFDTVAEALSDVAAERGLLLVLDDVHWSDEPSLLVLRHLADRVADAPLLILATFRDVEPHGPLPRVLPDLLRAPAVEQLVPRRFGLAEVTAQLGDAGGRAHAVLDATGGNPLFVREVARAIADGSWRADRAPRTVLDLVGARVARLTPDCRAFLQAAAIVGRQVTLTVVAAAVGDPVVDCLPRVDEAVAFGLLEAVGDGQVRFTHALTRDAVEASLTTAARIALHRAVADALEAHWAGDLDDHLAELARHRLALAPYGEAAAARGWAVRAADEAVRRLAFEEGVRLYREALAVDAAWPDRAAVCGLQLALGRAAYLAGDIDAAAAAAGAAAAAARSAERADLLGEAALVLDAVVDPVVNAGIAERCDEALARLTDGSHAALRARLLAQRSHLAFYAGERTDETSRAALAVARACADDRALVDALRARQEACPGPAGRAERLQLAAEMLAAARRSGSARTAMWGRLWRVDALLEGGELAAAREELAPLEQAAAGVGGPGSAWHHHRVVACVAQAQGRFGEAAEASRRGYERMRAIEPSAAVGAFLGLQCGLARHVGTSDEALVFARSTVAPPPRFVTMGRVARAYLLLGAGLPDEAAAQQRQAGPPGSWSWPVFFVAPGTVLGVLVAIALGLDDELAATLAELERFRGEHVVGSGVYYLGPAELTLGIGALAQGRLDAAVTDLDVAVARAERAGAPGFVAEALHHLALALLARSGPGDRERARRCASGSDRLVRALGMAVFTQRSAALLRRLGGTDAPSGLSAREEEVAHLVAEGLTNRGIAERLVISERTAGNHVAHILTKLDLASRSQVAAWCMSSTLSGSTHARRGPDS